VRPQADPRLLAGVIFGQLGAAPEARAYYRELESTVELAQPGTWSELDVRAYDALLLPGGHAPGMRQYLGSDVLQARVAEFWKLGRPVAAICHGVLATGRSVLARSRTTCLPRYMERTAYLLTSWKLGRYYRTYDAYVEDEVRAALASPDEQFVRGPRVLTKLGTSQDDSAAFVVEDGRYLSARWPGDAYLFAKKLIERL
jgi:putative intracellular protease/amidase